VIRPQDLTKTGKGSIRILNPEGSEALRVTGINTEFKSQLFPKDTIVLVGHSEDKAEVVQVISDTELLIKCPFKSLDELVSEEGSLYKCMPHVVQAAVYKSVHDELYNGGCITIFPEGGSHDRVEMLPLKGINNN
jgi:hypothetical protein